MLDAARGTPGQAPYTLIAEFACEPIGRTEIVFHGMNRFAVVVPASGGPVTGIKVYSQPAISQAVLDQDAAQAEAMAHNVRALTLLGVSVGEVIADLQARLQASRECRDAAQAEATKQTLAARAVPELQREIASLKIQIREAFDEGFAVSKAGGPIETAWDRSQARQDAV